MILSGNINFITDQGADDTLTVTDQDASSTGSAGEGYMIVSNLLYHFNNRWRS